ncbi:MAG TPA: saccharopine dehydrogenase NADP-binding domain-containing protein [Euzebyales bacterium]
MRDQTNGRDHDIVVFGATGFVGRLVAEHLAARAPAGVRVALAGRSAQRLAAVRDALGPPSADWPLLVVNAADQAAVGAMAAATRVVATTVGPYARYGMAVVAACAGHGTDYVDLTGEVLFVRDSADRHHERAAATGARIVHSCGFDSVPSDLSVLMAARAAADDATGELDRATLVLRSASGGVSGGTIETLRTQLEHLADDPARRRVVDDPYALSPDRSAEPDLGPQPDVTGPRFDRDLGTWTGPFVMAAYNTRVVRRSNALQGWAYGRRLRYREVVGFGRGPTRPLLALGMTTGIAVLFGGMRFAPTRALLDRVLPAPGAGPDARTRADGHFRFDLYAHTVTGARYGVAFGAQGDPGYAATSVMIGESALALATDQAAVPSGGGVLTPATGIGRVLVDRLRAAGFEIRVDRAV